jgi:hypothetical protein
MAGLGRYELILLEKQFVGRVKKCCERNGMITEQQESILEGINREKIRWMEKTPKGKKPIQVKVFSNPSCKQPQSSFLISSYWW